MPLLQGKNSGWRHRAQERFMNMSVMALDLHGAGARYALRRLAAAFRRRRQDQVGGDHHRGPVGQKGRRRSSTILAQ
jgi:hypothetical protein